MLLELRQLERVALEVVPIAVLQASAARLEVQVGRPGAAAVSVVLLATRGRVRAYEDQTTVVQERRQTGLLVVLVYHLVETLQVVVVLPAASPGPAPTPGTWKIKNKELD